MTTATLETSSGEILLSGDVWLNHERPGLATFYPHGDQLLEPGICPATLRADGGQNLRIVRCYPCPAAVLHYHLGYDPRT